MHASSGRRVEGKREASLWDARVEGKKRLQTPGLETRSEPESRYSCIRVCGETGNTTRQHIHFSSPSIIRGIIMRRRRLSLTSSADGMTCKTLETREETVLNFFFGIRETRGSCSQSSCWAATDSPVRPVISSAFGFPLATTESRWRES